MNIELGTALPAGTLLRQRYLIEKTLGQGGFGQTYLAADQERFNEPCVIKEFRVPYQDDELIDKAKALFQREASILYQVQHPQIPRFWAAFENEQRLFLVQDFVKGQTYRRLLKDRKQQSRTFSEAEVLYLLNHLLPVLSYLHDREIIHRDISLENIILQPTATDGAEDDFTVGLPVLLDFGAVKEAASHWPIVSTITRVGKVGYAPPEQLQTGNVSPHSDLYALGATCLVLMTGREPQTLLDSQTLTWQWQPYTRMSDQLANVFQKMLALHPGDRYQTAREAWADLQPLMEGAVEDTVLNSAPDIAPAARDIIETRVFTTIKSKLRMDAGKREPVDSATPRSMLRHLEASRARRKRGMAPGVAIATSLLVVAGIGTYLFKVTAPSQQSVLDGPRRSNPVLVSDGKARKIEFAAGDISKIEQGNLLNTNAQPYLLEARQGQIMTLTLEGAGVTMNILRANGQKIDSSAYQTRSWTGQLPADEEYMIQVTGSGGYWLDVAITPEASSPVSDFQRVKFARGKASTTVTGTLLTKRVRRYALTASTNQLMTIRVLKGNVNVVVNSPKGERIGSSSPNARYWQGKLKMAGEHIVEISALDKTDYALSLEIR